QVHALWIAGDLMPAGGGGRDINKQQISLAIASMMLADSSTRSSDPTCPTISGSGGVRPAGPPGGLGRGGTGSSSSASPLTRPAISIASGNSSLGRSLVWRETVHHRIRQISDWDRS